MIASHSFCRFVGCTSIMRISHSTTSQMCCILDWDLVTVEAIWVKWTPCHVQETSLRWFELCDMVHYPAGSSHQKMDRHGQQQYSGRLWHLNDAQLVLSVSRKYPPHHYTTTNSLNHWDKAGWIYAFMFFTCSCGSVVEHCVSNAKVVGSIPREHTYWPKMYNLNVVQLCKSLWIKASAKCINVNVDMKIRPPWLSPQPRWPPRLSPRPRQSLVTPWLSTKFPQLFFFFRGGL